VPEGQAVSLSGAGSLDPNGTVASYAWSFGDGSTGEGVAPSHVYAQAGEYVVTLTVTDNDGLTDSAAFTVTVTDVPAPPTLADRALPLIDQLVSGGRITRPVGALLRAGVVAAQRLLDSGRVPAARLVIRTVIAEIDLLVRLRVVPAATLAPLRAVLVGGLTL
jgi:hypothetical protein